MLKRKGFYLWALVGLILMFGATVTASAASIGETWILLGQPALYTFVVVGVVFAFIALLKIPKFTVFAIAISIVGFGVAGISLIDMGEVEVSITPGVSWDVRANRTATLSNVTLSGNLITINLAINKTAVTLLIPGATEGGTYETTAFVDPVIYFVATPTNTNPNIIVDSTMLAWTEANVGTIYPVEGTTREYDLITHSGSGANRVQHIYWTHGGVTQYDQKDISCAYGSAATIKLEIDPYALALCQLDQYDSESFTVSVAGETYTVTFYITNAFGTLA